MRQYSCKKGNDQSWLQWIAHDISLLNHIYYHGRVIQGRGTDKDLPCWLGFNYFSRCTRHPRRCFQRDPVDRRQIFPVQSYDTYNLDLDKLKCDRPDYDLFAV